MKGCRDLTDQEFQSVMDYFTMNDQLRDRTIFSVQRWAGYRISEVLSLRVRDVFYKDDEGSLEVVDRIHVQRKNMKGSRKPRRVIVHNQLREDLREYIRELSTEDGFSLDWFLFKSRKGENKAISYTQAYRIIKAAFDDLGIRENVATHSFRKTFANRVYENTDHDIIATMKIMDHSSPNITMAYLSADQQKLEEAVMMQ